MPCFPLTQCYLVTRALLETGGTAIFIKGEQWLQVVLLQASDEHIQENVI